GDHPRSLGIAAAGNANSRVDRVPDHAGGDGCGTMGGAPLENSGRCVAASDGVHIRAVDSRTYFARVLGEPRSCFRSGLFAFARSIRDHAAACRDGRGQLERAAMEKPSDEKSHGPLAGVKILELGQAIAGPFATEFLAWFGAEVIKVEPPGTGDPLRSWRVMHKGTSLWWYSMARNKKCITLNLRVREGQKIARELAKRVDVVVENFRPGTLERWGLGYEELKRENPRLILARISGYGQTGPYAQKPGFALVAEAFGGLRYVTGEPERPPVRPNLSLGDSVAGLHAALGIVMALYHRDARGGHGQEIDV